MSSTDNALIQMIMAQLTPGERDEGVVYLATETVPAGTKLAYPRVSIEAPWNAAVAFIDREPAANWSHSCCYLLINPETGETHTFEAQLPPFRPDQRNQWRVIYKAPSVPDSMLMNQL